MVYGFHYIGGGNLSKEKFEKINIEDILREDIYDIDSADFGWQRDVESHSIISFGYIMSYKEAGDTLIENHGAADIMMFAIFFSYRQYLELLLKEVYRKKVNYDNELFSEFLHRVGHDLDKIWKETSDIVKEYLNGYNFKEKKINRFIDFFGKIIAIFAELDPMSFNFRYPTDKQANDSLNVILHINFKHLKRAIEAIDDIMYGVYGL